MGLITPVGKYTGTPVGTSLCLATCPAVWGEGMPTSQQFICKWIASGR